MTYNKDEINYIVNIKDKFIHDTILDIKDRINALYEQSENLIYIFNALNYDKFTIYEDSRYIDGHDFDTIVFNDISNNLKFEILFDDKNNIINLNSKSFKINHSILFLDKLLNDFDIYVDIISNNTTSFHECRDNLFNFSGTSEKINLFANNSICCENGTMIKYKHFDLDSDRSIYLLVYVKNANIFLKNGTGKISMVIYNNNGNQVIYIIDGDEIKMIGMDSDRLLPLSFPEQVKLYIETINILGVNFNYNIPDVRFNYNPNDMIIRPNMNINRLNMYDRIYGNVFGVNRHYIFSYIPDNPFNERGK